MLVFFADVSKIEFHVLNKQQLNNFQFTQQKKGYKNFLFVKKVINILKNFGKISSNCINLWWRHQKMLFLYTVMIRISPTPLPFF